MTASGEYKLKTRLLLIWQKSLPIVLDRLDLLDHAVSAEAEGRLSLDLRNQASAVAHQLAGSLGMFGHAEGTRLAREIELTLSDYDAARGRLAFLTSELRREVTGESRRPARQLLAG